MVAANQAGSSNYAAAPQVTQNIAVSRATLTVTAINASKIYGAANPTFSFSYSGFKNGDTATTAVSGAPSLTTTAGSASGVGSYPITVSGGTLTASNYAFSFVNGTLTITKAMLTVAANNASRLFGTANPTFSFTYSGFVNGDTSAIFGSESPVLSTTASSSSNAGTYPITLAIGTLTATNYSFSLVNGTLTINPFWTYSEIAASPNPSNYNQQVVFTSLVDTGGNWPTGTVAFKNGSTLLANAAVNPVIVTNMVPYSQQLGTSPWSGYCGSTTNRTLNTTDVTAPDGSNTATKFVMPSSFSCGSGVSYGELTFIPGGLTSGQSYTVSVWLRGAIGGEQVRIGVDDCNNTIVRLTNTWARYSYSVSAYSACNPTRGFEFLGTTAGSTYYIWGPQTETDGSEGPYVPTPGNSAQTGYGGVATYAMATLGAGTQSISAAYSGDTNDIASGPASLSLTVNTVTPTLTLAWSPSSPIQNTPVTFTCTATYGRPVGDSAVLQIWLDGTSELTAAAPSGSLSWPTSALTSGTHDIGCSVSGQNYNSVRVDSNVAVSGKFDTGVIRLTVNGVVASTTTYGGTSNPETVAAGLAAGQTSNSPVNLSEEDGILFLNAKSAGLATNYSYTLQTTSYDSTDFSQPSFVPSPITNSLDGGADAGASEGTVYSYSIPSYTGSSPTGYDAVGNIVGYTDSVNGTWSFTPDSLNRLVAASYQQPGIGHTRTYTCWSYDAFGNRTAQINNGVTSCPTSITPTMSYSANNQIAGGLIQFSAAGTVTADNTHGISYLYNSDGQVCAVKNQPVGGTYTMVGYIYNAEGERVAKGYISAWTCDIKASGFQPISDYVIGPNGEQLTETGSDGNGNMVWSHTNVYAGGTLMATYDGDGLHFHLSDWLGNRRVQTDYTGVTEQSCTNLPFGDNLACTGSLTSPTEQHFTGKERDSESGNDYFGARYYASSLGRWMSPDPTTFSLEPENPQSWNKYSYAFNRPLTHVDSDGKWSTWYHHVIIQDTFGNLGAHAVTVLDNASDWVDSVSAGNQAPERSFMHSMRDGQHNQTVEDAQRAADAYVETEMSQAVNDQITYEASGHTGYSDDALTHFGHALHTVTDATSPEHAGFQPWYCLYCASALSHHDKEETSAKSSVASDEEARYEAHVAAARLWSQYQTRLAAKRAKMQKCTTDASCK